MFSTLQRTIDIRHIEDANPTNHTVKGLPIAGLITLILRNKD